MNLKNVTADQLVDLYRNRKVTVTEVIQGVYDEIERTDPGIRAFLSTYPERALDEARRLDERIAAGESLEPLAGVPIAVKDNINVQGMSATCGSKVLEGYVPPYTATAVERLQKAGAIVVGKTNCDEFGMGSTTENSGYFITRNPHNTERVPGGSSGGSAASVAAATSLIALGSDTGGSVRTPAAFCGVVGLKPTYGRVSRYGLVAFGSSLDQIGPISKSIRETARALNIMAGFDQFDSTSADVQVDDYVADIETPIKDLRIGIPKEYFIGGLAADVKTKIEAGMKIYESLGCKLEEITLPHTEYAVATYYLIATAEASSNLARYDGVRYGPRMEASSLQQMYRRTRKAGFGDEVKRRIVLGTYALSAGYYDAYYLKALKVRTLILRDFQKAFEKVAVILAPTTPTVAFGIGEKTGDPLSMYLSDIFTITQSLAGIPAVSIPCGKNCENMPIGMQLMANHFQESLLLNVAHHFEKAGGFTV